MSAPEDRRATKEQCHSHSVLPDRERTHLGLQHEPFGAIDTERIGAEVTKIGAAALREFINRQTGIRGASKELTMNAQGLFSRRKQWKC